LNIIYNINYIISKVKNNNTFADRLSRCLGYRDSEQLRYGDSDWVTGTVYWIHL